MANSGVPLIPVLNLTPISNSTASLASPTLIFSSTTKQDIAAVLSFNIGVENLDDKSIEARSLVITVLSGFTNLALTSNVTPLATAIVTSSNDNDLISILISLSYFNICFILSFLNTHVRYLSKYSCPL